MERTCKFSSPLAYEILSVFQLCQRSDSHPLSFTRITEAAIPAAGYRNYNDGDTNNRGNNGNYWCSKPNSSYANNLNFNSGNVNMNNNNRANGYSVRCVQNLHACLFLKDMIGHTETDVIFPFCNRDSLKSKYALHSWLFHQIFFQCCEIHFTYQIRGIIGASES